jgi:hypothetical protein
MRLPTAGLLGRSREVADLLPFETIVSRLFARTESLEIESLEMVARLVLEQLQRGQRRV